MSTYSRRLGLASRLGCSQRNLCGRHRGAADCISASNISQLPGQLHRADRAACAAGRGAIHASNARDFLSHCGLGCCIQELPKRRVCRNSRHAWPDRCSVEGGPATAALGALTRPIRIGRALRVIREHDSYAAPQQDLIFLPQQTSLTRHVLEHSLLFV